MELRPGEMLPMTSVRVVTHRCTAVDNETGPTLDETPGTLESDVGPEVYQELLASFVAHLSLQVITLNAAVDDGDVPAARGVAHQIKGTASSFGAMRLDELAKRVLQMTDTEISLLRSQVDEIDAEARTFQTIVGASARPHDPRRSSQMTEALAKTSDLNQEALGRARSARRSAAAPSC